MSQIRDYDHSVVLMKEIDFYEYPMDHSLGVSCAEVSSRTASRFVD